jgi:hypothetical protein
MDTEQCLGNTYRRYINQKMAMKLSETSFGSNVKLKNQTQLRKSKGESDASSFLEKVGVRGFYTF